MDVFRDVRSCLLCIGKLIEGNASPGRGSRREISDAGAAKCSANKLLTQ